ncbi:hypothetical protein [Collimonas sp.]|uniref:hypothetical protein n=1 Tax=Collimonas sp. TaxID=1963772 RepID=UPI0037C13117
MKCLAELTETQDKTLQQLSINHKHRHIRTIDQEAPNPWQVDHHMRLFDLLTYSPELNMIELPSIFRLPTGGFYAACFS